jgi:hypothetical protein
MRLSFANGLFPGASMKSPKSSPSISGDGRGGATSDLSLVSIVLVLVLDGERVPKESLD